MLTAPRSGNRFRDLQLRLLRRRTLIYKTLHSCVVKHQLLVHTAIGIGDHRISPCLPTIRQHPPQRIRTDPVDLISILHLDEPR